MCVINASFFRLFFRLLSAYFLFCFFFSLFSFSFLFFCFFFFSSRRRHTRSLCDWSSDVCSSDLSPCSSSRSTSSSEPRPWLCACEQASKQNCRIKRSILMPAGFTYVVLAYIIIDRKSVV